MTTLNQKLPKTQMIFTAASTTKQQRSQRQLNELLLFVLLTCAFVPMSAYVVPPPTSLQQQQQQRSYEKASMVAKSTTRLYEKKRTKGSSGGGFGSVVKDIMMSSALLSNTDTTKTFPFTGTTRPGKQSPQRVVVDESIIKPDYWQTGTPLKTKKGLLPWMIEVKTSEEIMKMKQAGILARHILDMAGRAVRPGITTDEIDTIVHDEIIKVSENIYMVKQIECCFYLFQFVRAFLVVQEYIICLLFLGLHL